MENKLSLYELNNTIKESIKKSFYGKYHVVAEISEINESRGHAYIELIEKDENDQLIAKVRATIWANTFRMLKPYFETTTGHKLESGLKILIVVTIEFHEVYGFSLNVLDIDPTYTIGDIEKKRLAIIKRLEKEGIFDMNKELDLPPAPQKIAVISSETAAGYGDFMDQLHKNDYAYKFYTKLFKASMQGEDTESSIIDALERIYEYEDVFDLVVIIRGGGSKSDLNWFDSYDLAVNIAQFPLPVLSGIGHERDETITDLVVHTYLKTPTAVAEFLISEVLDFDIHLDHLGERFADLMKDNLSNRKEQLEKYALSLKTIINETIIKHTAGLDITVLNFKNAVYSLLEKNKFDLQKYPDQIRNIVRISIHKKNQNIKLLDMKFNNEVFTYIKLHKHKLEVYSQKNNYLNPNTILERGYSLTIYKDRLLKSIKHIKKGDIIETRMIDGSFKSKVEN